jgi:hypothetical protein
MSVVAMLQQQSDVDDVIALAGLIALGLKMRIFVVVLALGTLATGQGQQPITIHGHALGESLSDFLTEIQHPDAVQKCQAFLAQKRPKEFVFGPKDQDPSFEAKRCREIVTASQGQPSAFTWVRVGKALFNHNTLVGIQVEFVNSLEPLSQQVSYLTVLEDATRKYGKPTEEGTSTSRNAIGATIRPRYANWVRSDVLVNLHDAPESTNPGYEPDITFSVVLKSEAEFLRESARPNVLDSK